MTTADRTVSEYRAIRVEAVEWVAERIVLDPPEDDDLAGAIPSYVRDWTDEQYDDVLGRYDPAAVEAAVPTDPDQVDTGRSAPPTGEEDEDRRRELHAVHAVRADLTKTLRENEARLARAIAVHDALERLVGKRGGRTDRRPSAVVEAFADWVAGERDEAVVDRARSVLTPLHVMRIDPLTVVETPRERHLLRALEAWLHAEHPAAYDPPPGGDV